MLNSKAKIRTPGMDAKLRTQLSHMVPRPANDNQDELDKLKQQREKEIDVSLTRLNNDIYQNEKGLGSSAT